MKDMSPRVGRPFRKVCTSPQGEGFPPSPKETLKREGLAQVLSQHEKLGVGKLPTLLDE